MTMTDKSRIKADLGEHMTVLIVDDSPANLEVVENCLKECGFTTLVATSAETALKRVSYSRPDLILLDVMMPGIDGFETCRTLKSDEETRSIPVIFMTALTDPEHKVKGFTAGAVDYITKPVEKKELLARVTTHLKIHIYQNHLEKEVEKRTEELEERMAALNREVTERKQTEEELDHLRNYLKNIIDSMPSVIIGVDSSGRVTQWNKTAEQTTGISVSNAHGKNLSDVFPRMASQIERITESIRTRETRTEQKVPRKSKGGTCYEDVTIYPLIADGFEGAVIRIDDVTDKVRMEETMIQSEKMMSVGGLAAGMAHEINNPVAGMMQSAEVINNRLTNTRMPSNIQAAEEIGIRLEDINSFMEKRGILRMVEAISESGRRVAAIVENMLSFSRKSDAAVSPCDMAVLVDKTLALASSDYDRQKHHDFKSIEIVKEYDDNLPHVVCEGPKIQQVLLNILRNGAQAMQEMGQGKKHRFIIRLSTKTEPNMFRIEIEDNGPGISEAVRKRIFEPFFTTKPNGAGTGLGLSVSYFIITENHGGTMEVESEPGEGTVFIIRLPLKR